MGKTGRLLLSAVLLAAAVFLSGRISLLLSGALEQVDQSFLFEYATEGKFREDVYFSPEVQARTGILTDLLPHLDAEEAGGPMGLAKQVALYQAELLPVFCGNAAYLRYLREQDTSVTELYQYCRNIDELAENLVLACRYLLFLCWVIVLHFLLKSRPVFYFFMGLACVFASVLRLSNRLFAGAFSDGEVLFHLYAADLIPAMLEAMLTFLIFDITFTALEKARLSRRLAPLREDLPALWALAVRLSLSIGSESPYRPHLSALLPHFYAAAAKPPRGARGKAFAAAVRALERTHTNRTLLRDLLALQALLPPP